MPYHRWVIHQALSRQRKVERARVYRRADSVINNAQTVRKKLSDFPAVETYLTERFPGVDLSEVAVYVAPPKVIDKAGWKDAGGCYVRDLDIILVKSKMEIKPKGKFQRLVHELCESHVDVEDVIVHEFIHAVSSKIGRSLARYTHMEEEFVYTNCIDFYKQKGLSEEDIANNNFLPFCLNDVYRSKRDMTAIFSQIGAKIEQLRELTEAEYQKWANSHAEELVPLLKERAQKKAHQMIELYKKYGDLHKTSADEETDDLAAERFASLEFD